MCRTKFITGDEGHRQTRSTFPCQVITEGTLIKAARTFTVDCVFEHFYPVVNLSRLPSWDKEEKEIINDEKFNYTVSYGSRLKPPKQWNYS